MPNLAAVRRALLAETVTNLKGSATPLPRQSTFCFSAFEFGPMTADIINLRQARKAKARAEKERRAEENRRKFGRPKHERARAEAESLLEENRLDGLRRDAPDADPQA
jgi:Domain of unknown function (DUF4169)